MDRGSAQEAIARLSDQQVRLLRLVAAGVTSSKALAQQTGLRPGSIDTYLQAAARQLDAENRIEAARRLLLLEQESSQSASQLRTRHLAASLKSAIFRVARAARWFATGLPLGGQRHAYSWKRVALEIFRVALLGMAGLFVLVLFVLGFLKTFR
jgi:DNA-binding CsgD family transcriptional regulator